jgi:hypothetical protein
MGKEILDLVKDFMAITKIHKEAGDLALTEEEALDMLAATTLEGEEKTLDLVILEEEDSTIKKMAMMEMEVLQEVGEEEETIPDLVNLEEEEEDQGLVEETVKEVEMDIKEMTLI